MLIFVIHNFVFQQNWVVSKKDQPSPPSKKFALSGGGRGEKITFPMHFY
jgi:hypothetical protein